MTLRLERAEWDRIVVALTIRSAGRCEIQSPLCLAGRHGDLGTATRSLHHRMPRQMGGTSRANVHSLSVLVLTCGDGTTGCHGYTEARPEWARGRYLKLPTTVDPDLVPLVLPSGRMVRLDPVNPAYEDWPGGPWYCTSPQLHKNAKPDPGWVLPWLPSTG